MQAHRNNIGVLRLVLASLVILSHAPNLATGSRDILGSVAAWPCSVGRLAVDGFFLLSGYLITQSMGRSHSVWSYLQSRVMRIYPAFIVATLASLALGAWSGARPWLYPKQTLGLLMFLQMPMSYPGQLPGVIHYPALNGAMWTIAYEFRCYLLVALLGVTGMLARPRFILTLTVLSLLAMVASTVHPLAGRLDALVRHEPYHLYLLLGDAKDALRLAPAFAVGMCIYLYRQAFERLLNWPTALGCLLATALLLPSANIGEAAVITLGAVTLFWLALRAELGRLQRVNDSWDISYGVYLYGWPVSIGLCWLIHPIGAFGLAAASLPLAYALGACSWWLVEAPTKGLRLRRFSLAGVWRGEGEALYVR